jgi:hypothetical protein
LLPKTHRFANPLIRYKKAGTAINIDRRINKPFLEINEINRTKKTTRKKPFSCFSMSVLARIEQNSRDNKNSIE